MKQINLNRKTLCEKIRHIAEKKGVKVNDKGINVLAERFMHLLKKRVDEGVYQGNNYVVVDDPNNIEAIIKGNNMWTLFTDELKEKVNPNDCLLDVGYSDYGGSIVDRAIIDYCKENSPNNIVSTNTAYNGQIGILFGTREELNEIIDSATDEFLVILEQEITDEEIDSVIEDYGLDPNDQDLREYLEDFFDYNARVEPNMLDYNDSTLEKALEEKGFLTTEKSKNESIKRTIINGIKNILREEKTFPRAFKDNQKEAAYENALDCLYYGYGPKDWNSCGLSDEDAKMVWKKAVAFMYDYPQD